MDLLPNDLYCDKVPNDYLKWALQKYYHVKEIHNEIYYAYNILWPEINLDSKYNKYFLSFHTEYLDVDWVIQQAEMVYPKPILIVTDYEIEKNSVWPDNITFARYVTIHHQLTTASTIFGVNLDPQKPKYKISSLCMRIAQYKRFVTAYLLQNFDPDQMILSFHAWLGKQQDLHDFPMLDHLKDLNLDLEKTFINIDNELAIINNSPVENTNWHIPAVTNALVNLTNESVNYSLSVKKDKPFLFPGAYLTDKTYKPLLGGRPFVPVGQAGTVKFLHEVGFKTDFGYDLTYDEDTGDLTRIKGVFDTIDFVSSESIDNLYESSLHSVKHNTSHIINGGLLESCEVLNKSGLDIIRSWHA